MTRQRHCVSIALLGPRTGASDHEEAFGSHSPRLPPRAIRPACVQSHFTHVGDSPQPLRTTPDHGLQGLRSRERISRRIPGRSGRARGLRVRPRANPTISLTVRVKDDSWVAAHPPAEVKNALALQVTDARLRLKDSLRVKGVSSCPPFLLKKELRRLHCFGG